MEPDRDDLEASFSDYIQPGVVWGRLTELSDFGEVVASPSAQHEFFCGSLWPTLLSPTAERREAKREP